MSQTSTDFKTDMDALARTVGGDMKEMGTRLSSLEENGVPPQISQRVEALEASQAAQDTAIQAAADAADAALPKAGGTMTGPITIGGKQLTGADGTLMYGGKKLLTDNDLSGNGTVPVGGVVAFAANSAPSGYLLCNGAAVSRTTYAALFAVIGTTYGTGDNSTTFNLPDLTDKFIQGSATSGTVKAAGLPNITGKMNVGSRKYDSVGVEASGALSDGGNGGKMMDTSSASGTNAYTYQTISFDASGSNSIYGSSTTVQPPALTMRYYIKY